MSLPSQDILDEIKKLITEITGFQESDENFLICERYCLSHVVHHSYPFTNKTTVKDLVNSYVSRFYGHGYFKVSQELDFQVEKFLSNEKLFQKNPQYDIQWCLLSLVSSLSSNLSLRKELPELLPVDADENEEEDINWSKYLLEGLPQSYFKVLSSDNGESTQDEDDDKSDLSVNLHADAPEQMCQNNEKAVILIEDNTLYKNKKASQLRKERMEEFLTCKRSISSIESDVSLRGNISEIFDSLVSQEGVNRKCQYISEHEMMESILYQFQTGERVLLRKGLVNPALMSLTQDTLNSFLESLQPYFKIIRGFKDFDAEVSEARYPEKYKKENRSYSKESQSILSSNNSKKRKIPNVLYTYSIMLNKALEPFQNDVTSIVDNLGESTLIQMERKLQPHFFDLTSLYYVHNLATRNWKDECNWMSSVRILSVLYNAIMDATTAKMSFVYLNIFLGCFQIFLDIIDTWISFVDLIDPHDEFIVTKSESSGKSDNFCSEYEIRPYKMEMKKLGIKEIPILDFIADTMVHVGQSLEVLRRLGRFVPSAETSKQSSHQLLVKLVTEKIRDSGKVKSTHIEWKIREKKKSIFTMRNINLILERDEGGGDNSNIGSFLLEEVKEEEKKEFRNLVVEETKCEGNHCTELIYSTINNAFLKMAFEDVGIKYLRRKLDKPEGKEEKNDDENEFLLVTKTDDESSSVYPFHKIISKSIYLILGDRVSDACSLVKNIVLAECSLQTHLSLLRSIFLFYDSYLIQSFIIGLFTQPVIWRSSYSLTLHLKECVEVRYKEFARYLSVSVAKAHSTESKNILEAIDAITVNYEVKWPLTLIFIPEIMAKYNKIFRLALKLKWAHWALSGLQFQSGDEKSGILKSSYHRLQLLRFWFLSALSRINNYYMVQMIPMDVEMSSCKDLKTMISVHSNYIEKVYDRCLLGEKSSEGHNLIFQTLIPLCMELESFWREGNIVTNTKLTSMETIFGHCHLQLSRLMSYLEKE